MGLEKRTSSEETAEKFGDGTEKTCLRG
jgi:hypothetical protein